ncbi:MAG: hypothetical protein AB8B96_11505 [Lysobacterales bacterium]
MLVLTPTKLILIVAFSCLLLPPTLGFLAKNRGRRVVTWALLGALPLVNIAALIVLLWTPLIAEQEAIRRRELQLREVIKEGNTGPQKAISKADLERSKKTPSEKP